MSWTAMSMTGRKRPLSFSSMKKLFPLEICNSNSRYCVCSNMTLIGYLKYLGIVIIIFFSYFQYSFLVEECGLSLEKKIEASPIRVFLVSISQVPLNTGHCGRRILCHC